MQPTPVFLPGKSHGLRSLADYSLRLMSQGVGISRQSRAPEKGTSLFPQGNTQEDLSLGRAGVCDTLAGEASKMQTINY